MPTSPGSARAMQAWGDTVWQHAVHVLNPTRPLLHGTRAIAGQIITSILLIVIAMTILLQDATTEWLGPRQRPMRI